MYPERLISHNWLAKRAINSKVKDRLPAFSGMVIDLGCGIRPFEHDILQYADEYVGVEWSNTLHGLKADLVADLNRPLPITSEVADHIVSFEVMEHLAEPQIMLSEAFRILRHKGQLTLSVPFQWWVHEAPWDYYRYTRHGLEHMLQKAGFKDIIVAPTTGFWSMWLLKFNYQSARLLRGPRPVRMLVRAALIPIWFTNQRLGQAIDSIWREDRETAGYFVTACKP